MEAIVFNILQIFETWGIFSDFPPFLLGDICPCDAFRPIDLFTNTVAILDSIVSDIYYGMLRGQIHTNLPPEHPIITI